MTKPNDIPQDVWDKAHEILDGYLYSKMSPDEAIARAIMAAKEEAEAERDMLQDILDGRPAINAGLPDSYIRWSQAIYSGDFVRASIRNLKLANNTNKDYISKHIRNRLYIDGDVKWQAGSLDLGTMRKRGPRSRLRISSIASITISCQTLQSWTPHRLMRQRLC